MRIQLARRSLVLVAMLGAIACSDSSGSGKDEADAGPMSPGPDAMPGPGGPGGPSARELVIDGAFDRLIAPGQTIPLVVALVQGAARTPVTNERVNAAVIDSANQEQPTGVEGTGLTVTTVNTDTTGRATFQLQSLAAARPATFRVRAQVEGAAPVFWNIVVAREGTGGLSVQVTYNCASRRYDYNDIAKTRISVFANQACAAVNVGGGPLPPAQFAIEISPYNDVQNRVSISDLAEGQVLAIVAQGITATDGVITSGCLDMVQVMSGQLTPVTIDMCDLNLEYKGIFLVENEFDLAAVLDESENETLQTVGTMLELIAAVGGGVGDNPETARGDAVVDLICEFADFSEGLCDVVRGFGARIIHELIELYVPPQVLDVLNILGDIYRIASEFTLIGELEFIQPRPDAAGVLTGNDNRWLKFRFIWRNGCPFPTIEECTREFTVGELGLDRRALAGAFDADATPADLHIRSHGITVHYGALMLALAEHWIIPTVLGVQGPVTLEDMLGDLIPCQDINAALPGGNPNSGLCEDILVDALSRVARQQLERLEFSPEQFRLEGNVTTADSDGDLRIDQLVNGVWNGTVDLGTPIAFPGTFRGCRRPAPGMNCELPAP